MSEAIKLLTTEEIVVEYLKEHCRCGRRLVHYLDRGVWACPFSWARHE